MIWFVGVIYVKLEIGCKSDWHLKVALFPTVCSRNEEFEFSLTLGILMKILKSSRAIQGTRVATQLCKPWLSIHDSTMFYEFAVPRVIP